MNALGNQRAISANEVPLLGMLGEQVHRRRDRIDGGVDPRPGVGNDRQGLATIDQLGSATAGVQRAGLCKSHGLLDEDTERLHTRADAMVHRAHHVEGRLSEVRQPAAFVVGKTSYVADHT